MKLCHITNTNHFFFTNKNTTSDVYEYNFPAKKWSKVTSTTILMSLARINNFSISKVIELLVEATSSLNDCHTPLKDKWLIVDLLEGTCCIRFILTDRDPTISHKIVGEIIDWRNDLL